MAQEVEQNIAKILRTQNCKKNIENKLTNKKLKTGKDTSSSDRMELSCMLFQVARDGMLTDHVYFFPCVFEMNDDVKICKEERNETEVPKIGSFIRTIKMDFDLKNFTLVVYDYQYLGGINSISPSNAAKVNWNSETISQIIRKNSTVKGGEILLDSYVNDKGVKEPFEYPKVQFLTVRGLEKILPERENLATSANVEKIRAPKDEDNQSKNRQNQEGKSELKESSDS